MKYSTESDEKSGRWTKREQKMFVDGLNLYQRNWKEIANYIKTRSSTQVRSHAQKFFIKQAVKNPVVRNCQKRSNEINEVRVSKVTVSTQYGDGMIFPSN